MIVKPEDVQVFFHWSGHLLYDPSGTSYSCGSFEVVDYEAKRQILKDKFGMECAEDIIDKLFERKEND